MAFHILDLGLKLNWVLGLLSGILLAYSVYSVLSITGVAIGFLVSWLLFTWKG
jgi:hypothetical protein